jgi:hypothetical protein
MPDGSLTKTVEFRRPVFRIPAPVDREFEPFKLSRDLSAALSDHADACKREGRTPDPLSVVRQVLGCPELEEWQWVEADRSLAAFLEELQQGRS